VDLGTGRATRIGSSNLTYYDVWGLTFIGNTLLGFTANDPVCSGDGSLIFIDKVQGTSTFIRCVSFDAGGADSPMPSNIPRVTSLSRQIGSTGDTLMIRGKNFGNNGVVYFGTEQTQIRAWTNTKIAVTVPPQSHTQTIQLTLPLANLNPETAAINSVFDHSMHEYYKLDRIVTAFNGAEGRKDHGAACPPRKKSYKQNPQGDPFDLGNEANYWGSPCRSKHGKNQPDSPRYLQYDGHNNVYSNPSRYNSIVVLHPNGFETWYLHARKHHRLAGDDVTENDSIAEVGCEGQNGCNEAKRQKAWDHITFTSR
jgi:hypothetical protein